jgi:hypothetical protein
MDAAGHARQQGQGTAMSSPAPADFDTLASAMAQLLKSAWEQQQAELPAEPHPEPARQAEGRDE